MGAIESINVSSLDLADVNFLARLLEDQKHKRRNAPSRRRDALIARWKASKTTKPPTPPTCPCCWTADDRKAWAKYASRADVRAFLANVAQIELDTPEAVVWWFALSDRERFDLEHISYKAINDEFAQANRRRAWRAAGMPAESANFEPDHIAVE